MCLRNRAVLAVALVVTAVGAAPGVAGAAPPVLPSSWPQFGQSARHLGTNPAETAFSPRNAPLLEIKFTNRYGQGTGGGPVVADGSMFIADFDGDLNAYKAAGCGSKACEPLWRGHADNDFTATPAVSGGLVLIASADHFLYAFPAAGCGTPTCAPRWKGQLADASIDSSVAVADGIAYVGDFSGHLYAFRVAGCGAAVCKPLWVGAGLPNELFGSPAVANGKVYVPTFLSSPDLFTGRLLAFTAAGCGAAACRPAWTADLGGPGTGVSVSGSTVFAGSSTLFGEGVNTDFHLFAFDGNGCSAAPTSVCKPLRSYRTGDAGILSAPAVSGGTLYATSRFSPDDPISIGVVSAYPAAGCAADQCEPAWTGVNFADGIASAPVVVGGVVFVGKGPASGFPVDAGMYGYNAAGCGSKVCRSLSFLQLSLSQGYLGQPLAVAEGTIYMASHDNIEDVSNVYAIGPPS